MWALENSPEEKPEMAAVASTGGSWAGSLVGVKGMLEAFKGHCFTLRPPRLSEEGPLAAARPEGAGSGGSRTTHVALLLPPQPPGCSRCATVALSRLQDVPVADAKPEDIQDLLGGALFKALYKWMLESGPVYLLPTGGRGGAGAGAGAGEVGEGPHGGQGLGRQEGGGAWHSSSKHGLSCPHSPRPAILCPLVLPSRLAIQSHIICCNHPAAHVRSSQPTTGSMLLVCVSYAKAPAHFLRRPHLQLPGGVGP